VPPDLPDDDEWLLRERQRIGRRIHDIRMDHDLTQERVYLAVPMTRSFYQGIEAGQENPSLNTLLRIARVIGVPISDLLGVS
jgi:transcriptional regulator with XRE-family HTH domain